MEAASGPQSVRLDSLELRLAPGSAPRPTLELYRRLTPTPDSEWIVSGPGDHAFLPIDPKSNDSFALHLMGSTDSRVQMPGPFDPHRFDYVGVEVDAGPRRRFQMHFRSGKKLAKSYASTRSISGVEIIEFAVPAKVRSWKNLTSLSVHTSGSARLVRILGASLVSHPASARLPAPEEGTDHIFADDQSRNGVGVLPQRAIETTFQAGVGRQLRFSFALPNSVAGEQKNTVLRLQLRSEDGVVDSREFTFDPQRPIAWQTAHVALDAFGDSQVRARWKVSGEGSVACALAEVGLLHPGGVPRRVVLITSDTHRYDHVGASGVGVEVLTPMLDALAERGVLFEDCFSSTNVTNPSHVALMTGTSPRDTGIGVNNAILSDQAPTLAEAFRAAGFTTFASVSIKHLSPAASGLGQGFDRSASPGKTRSREAAKTVAKAIDWLGESQELSVFLWVHLFDAHTPYETEAAITEIYYPSPERAYDPEISFPVEVPQVVDEYLYPGLRDIELPRAQYKAEISYLDTELGHLLDSPLLHDAIVGFTADHGESLGAHGIYFSHDGLYLDSIHVPMIISYPGGPLGERSRVPTEQIDLGRTLLDLAGLAGTEFPGTNLLAKLDDRIENAPPRFTVAAHFRSASITHEGWHLMLSMDSVGGQLTVRKPVLHAVELYHLEKDPGCEHDLFEQEFGRAKRMRAQLVEWLLGSRNFGWDKEMITDAETILELEALGYTAGAQVSKEDGPRKLFNTECRCEWCGRF